MAQGEYEKWIRRVFRLRRRARIAAADLARTSSWYVCGGRRFFTRHCAELVNAHKWCFVVGCNNSGTSLLQSILEQTGQVSTFEFEGQLYTRALRRSERRGYERVWVEYADDLNLSADEPLDAVPRLVHDWLRELSLPIREVIVEKTPANAVRLEWLQKAFPRSFFIGLVRNGYAVSEGIRRKGYKPVARGASHWNQVNRMMLDRSKNVRNFMLVHYEDLIDRRDEVIPSLLDFIGIDRSVYQSEPVTGSRDDHRTFRNFNAESIARLSEDDIEVIRQHAAEMLDHFGYTASTQLERRDSPVSSVLSTVGPEMQSGFKN